MTDFKTKFNNKIVKVFRAMLALIIFVSGLTIFGAYTDPAFNFLDFASGFFYGGALVLAVLLFIATRHEGDKP